jgi:hypothetical protein
MKPVVGGLPKIKETHQNPRLDDGKRHGRDAPVGCQRGRFVADQ